MNEIHVIFTGLVILMSGSMLKMEPPGNIFAAVAVEDNRRPEVPAMSIYDVTLPVHDAVFEMVTNNATFAYGTKPNRLFVSVDQQGNPIGQAVTLTGDQIGFGTYDVASSRCTPLFSQQSHGAAPNPAFEEVPHMSQIIPNIELELKDGAHPVNGDYGQIMPNMVSAWLDVHGGTLDATTDPDQPVRDFRPSRHRQKLADTATLTFVVPDDLPACVMITPFGAGTPDLVIKLPTQSLLEIKLRNTARLGPEGTSASALAEDTFPGITFDFELFYRLLKVQPCPPPIPHYNAELQKQNRLQRLKKKANQQQQPHGSMADPPEGAVCGPLQMR